MKIDFERVALLFNVLDQCRDYGSVYANIRKAAEDELKKIAAAENESDRPVVQTPAAGPPNSERVHPDGTVEQIGDGIPGASIPADRRDDPYADRRDPRLNNEPRNVERPRPQTNEPRPAPSPNTPSAPAHAPRDPQYDRPNPPVYPTRDPITGEPAKLERL